MIKTSPAVLRYLGALYRGGTLDGSSDGELLERVTAKIGTDRTETELAFATLMERHGRMVWRVCRSLVADDQDAEDAFQATFLVLVRKANTLRVRQTLGPWLHAVASRVSMSVRTASCRRRKIERAAGREALNQRDARSGDRSSESDELGVLLHQELARLPERFRAAVVLCDLEGLSYRQAAADLDIPLGTLQSRLGRARKRLRDRLAKRGLAPADKTDGLVLAAGPTVGSDAKLMPPVALRQMTCRHCLLLAAEPRRLHALISNSVQALVEKGARPMWQHGMAVVPIATIILCGGLLLGNSTAAKPLQDGAPAAEKATPTPQPRASNPVSAKTVPLVVPAPRETSATAGRGKVLVYALDENGDRIKLPPVVSKRRRRRGGEPVIDRPEKEMIADSSWVVVTGVIDHHVVAKNPLPHGREYRSLSPERVYRRVDLEREERLQNNTWSMWRAVDPGPTIRLLDNLPEIDAEKTPDELRVPSLVDPLPFLKAGVWEGVDVPRFVPKLRENDAKPPQGALAGLVMGNQPATTRKKASPPVLMLRQLDFAVEQGHTYRYRARLAVEDERWRRKEVTGPWSEPTAPVTVP